MTLKEGKGEGERETGVLLLCWMSRREEVYGQEEDEQLPLRRREGRAGARTATGADLDDVLLCPPYPSSPFSVLCNFLLPTSSWPSATRRLVNKTGRCPAPANRSGGRAKPQTKQEAQDKERIGVPVQLLHLHPLSFCSSPFPSSLIFRKQRYLSLLTRKECAVCL